ncbi:ribonuclease J [Cytobacillus sp. S13-E01]|uniref:ribonuclease J n=1 Tax=Cytobacillus sp. S13-E01 TaxID=3031326 RepID=UPI0023D83BF8|nr:ribonuclease J [Cytobacillus sp. S13-E01]MDF0727289.1 ribonuclease J [Cytobacillus sp. S13-E01]
MANRATTVKVIPLGGLGEVGKNMYLVEYNETIIIIDSGIKFPDSELFGIDYIIPDYTYLVENSHKIKGLFITHGHEDHIGGIPFLLKSINIPIYAGRLALGLIKSKLEEHHLLRDAVLHEINEDTDVSCNELIITFFATTHSIPDSYGIVVDTPFGKIVHTGDFKFDFTPVGKEPDLIRMGEIGKDGVLCLLSDSTNSEIPGFSMSEQLIGKNIVDIVQKQKGRVIFATFASNIYRLQEAIKASVLTNRKVCMIGRSMEKNIALGRELGYISAPPETFITAHEIKGYPANELTILCTGSQGEPFAALSRIAEGRHRYISVIPGDAIIFSSSPIPGNGVAVNRVIDKLVRSGAEVINHKLSDIHTSGHGAQEEQKLMIRLMKPKYFLPIHGEFKMQKMHQSLAIQCGVAKENTFLLDNGDVLGINFTGAHIENKVPGSSVYVDGSSIGEVGRSVLQERKVLSEHGMISIFILRKDGEIIGLPQIISRGFVYIRDSEELIKDIRKTILELLEERHISEYKIKKSLSDFIYKKTKRNPLIISKFIEI